MPRAPPLPSPCNGPTDIRSRSEYEGFANESQFNSQMFEVSGSFMAVSPPAGLEYVLEILDDEPGLCSVASKLVADSPKAHCQSITLSEEGLDVFGPRSGPQTTVELQGLPSNYSRVMLLQMLRDTGFEQCYDFVFLPLDFLSKRSFGSALINLISVDVAALFFAYYSESSRLTVSWSNARQGLLPCVEWFRNSAVMHAMVPDDFKPLLLVDGVAVPMPPPTQPIKAPTLSLREAPKMSTSPVSPIVGTHSDKMHPARNALEWLGGPLPAHSVDKEDFYCF